MSGDAVFDAITAKAKEIVAFHMVSHGLTPEFTPDEADAIELGMSSGIHAAIEYFRSIEAPSRIPGEET